MKSIFCILLILFLLLSVFQLPVLAEQPNPASIFEIDICILRAGGGSSGGSSSSSSSGGSSSHSHHSTGTRGRSSLLNNISTLILLPFFFFGTAIVFRFKLSRHARNSKKLLNMLERKDSAWKYKNIQKQVRVSYFAIQNAWTTADLAPAKPYMSDELFESFQTKINWMILRNERNVLKKIKLKEAIPVAVYDHADDTLDHVWFYIKGRMTDYTINTQTNEKISGNTIPENFEEYWQFTRKEQNLWVLNKILQKDEADQIAFTPEME